MAKTKKLDMDVYLFIPGELGLTPEVLSESAFFYSSITQQRAYYSDKTLLPLVHSRLAKRRRLSTTQYRVSLSLFAYQYVIALDKAVSSLNKTDSDNVTADEVDEVIELALDILKKLRRSIPYEENLKRYYENIAAFFTRSSAANIPVNMNLCKKLNLDEDTYSVSIPLGATINMAGAAITITVLTLAAVHTMGIEIDIFTAILLSLVAAVSACGASGVAGGSLLLIPLACGLFGISNDVAMQVVAVGFIIGVIQDSAETALNSSTDVVFTAAVCKAEQNKA